MDASIKQLGETWHSSTQLSCCGPRWDSLLEGGDPVAASSAPAVEVVDVEEAKGVMVCWDLPWTMRIL